VGLYGPAWFPDLPDAVFCLAGFAAQYYVCRRLGVSKWLNRAFVAIGIVIYLLLRQPPSHSAIPGREPAAHEAVAAALLLINIFFVAAAVLLAVFRRVPAFNKQRRRFLRVSSIAACAVPAAVIGTGIITRKDFQIIEQDIAFPNLPAGLDGLRLVQISDIHMSAFFSRSDLRRVVDAANGLRGDLLFVTGDLITSKRDPLDDCLTELARLRSGNGIYGCMGNHEAYAKCQTYTKRVAHRLGMDFLRYENRLLTFANSKLNLIGIDHQFVPNRLPGVEVLRNPEAFNLLLSHTPAIFPLAEKQKMDLTVSGHTHGGQINLEIAGTNFNLVDLTTPFTKGLYRRGESALYVNSGLGTIGVPVRIGAPPEITVIRLCKS
jgi:uncharacterized protein